MLPLSRPGATFHPGCCANATLAGFGADVLPQYCSSVLVPGSVLHLILLPRFSAIFNITVLLQCYLRCRCPTSVLSSVALPRFSAACDFLPLFSAGAITAAQQLLWPYCLATVVLMLPGGTSITRHCSYICQTNPLMLQLFLVFAYLHFALFCQQVPPPDNLLQ